MWVFADSRPELGSAAPAALLAVLLSALPVLGGGVAVVGTVLSDNGDQDGYADTQETVTLRLVVRNTSGQDLTGVMARLATTDGALACLTRPLISIGDLLAGEQRTTDEGFEFVVAPGVERTSVEQALSARFFLYIRSSDPQPLNTTSWIDVDLDLDVSGGGTPTTYFESFEGGFGSFTTMHLDESLNPPDSDLGNRPAGVANSDGWRCQYSDPDWEESASYGSSSGLQCFPNANGVTDRFYFNVVADRAFSGTQSMSFSIFLSQAKGYTSPSGQLEAIRTIDPINLGHGRVCSVSRSTACAGDLDCPPNQACEGVLPSLSFKHQISLMDHRTLSSAQHERGPERAIVAVQLAGSDGAGIGPWSKLYPFVNVYDTQANSNFFGCSFDPIDDGNTEEDFFDPTDPLRTQGPSSTCAPEFSFAHQGDTDGPYSLDSVGSGEPGSGLAGADGMGTWVAPQFDLSRYTGRRIRLRFLETGTKYSFVDWEQALAFNPDPRDDGWFIDDVTIVDALTDPPATVGPDTGDNSTLPFDIGDDLDQDGVFDVCDTCATLPDAGQADRDHDGVGDPCDPCPDDPFNDADGDGRCAPVDNCPWVSNGAQTDTDSDGTGDPCDTCPLISNRTQDLDEDEDGADCTVDNCPTVSNPDQADRDADGLGDRCDTCPDDPAPDADLDGACGAADSCPFYANPDHGRAVRLSGFDGGFSLSPDESTIVGMIPRLASMPAAGGQQVHLYSGSDQHAITPDGATVVFRGRVPGAGDRLFSVPIGGGEPLRLDLDQEGSHVTGFALTPDGSRVLYVQNIGGLGDAGFELFSVPTHGGPSVLLSTPWAVGENTDVAFVVGPDGSQVAVWRSGQSFLDVTPIDGGRTARLTAPSGVFSFVTQEVRFTPDGTRLVFRTDKLYAAPTDGSAAPIEISDPSAGSVRNFQLSLDGAWAFYEAALGASGVYELFQVSVLGGGQVKLNAPLLSYQDVSGFAVSPAGSHVVYRVVPGNASSWELMRVPAGGGAAELLGDGVDFAFTPDGSRVVYRSAGSDLFSRPIVGGGPVPLSDGSLDVATFAISGDGSYVTYSGGSPRRLFSVPVEGGSVVELSAGVGTFDVIYYVVLAQTHDGSATYWWGSGDHPGVYATWLEPDPDQDGVHRACDCDEGYPGLPEINDGLDNQCPGDAGFGLVDELQGTSGFTDPYDPNRLVWTALTGSTGYEVVRASDPGFTTGCACIPATYPSLSLGEAPPPGQTYYYLPRAVTPNRGSAGADSLGNERAGSCLSATCGD